MVMTRAIRRLQEGKTKSPQKMPPKVNAHSGGYFGYVKIRLPSGKQVEAASSEGEQEFRRRTAMRDAAQRAKYGR